jgi:hypothetical protein
MCSEGFELAPAHARHVVPGRGAEEPPCGIHEIHGRNSRSRQGYPPQCIRSVAVLVQVLDELEYHSNPRIRPALLMHDNIYPDFLISKSHRPSTGLQRSAQPHKYYTRIETVLFEQS